MALSLMPWVGKYFMHSYLKNPGFLMLEFNYLSGKRTEAHRSFGATE